MTGPHKYRAGDVALIRPEWDGDGTLFVIVEWDDGRGLITPLRWNHGPIRPIELVRAEMIEPAFPRQALRKARSAGARANREKGTDHA
mgnify:CR=1 FL=1